MRKFLGVFIFSAVLLVGCSSTDENADQLENSDVATFEKAIAAIESGEIGDAYTYLKDIVASEFENTVDVKQLLAQIQTYLEAEEAMTAGLYEEAKQAIEQLQQYDESISFIQEQLVTWRSELEAIATDVATAGNIVQQVTEQAASNFNQLSDNEVIDYIANYLNVSKDVLIVDVYVDEIGQRNFNIRQNNEKIPGADPLIAPSLGFFHIKSDGNLYEMDLVSAEDVKIN